MCLILLAWQAHPAHALVVAANRDEFHARPAEPARFWQDRPEVLAGRDLQAMGTWMGVARNGRFAAVTNYRGAHEPAAAQSRGALVTGFLLGEDSPAACMQRIEGARFSGFNLLASDGEELWWMSNRDGAPRRLEPGVYGLGNLLLDSPEVEADKARFRQAFESGPAVEPLIAVLAKARLVHSQYGTRCSTILLRGGGRTHYTERSYSPEGAELQTRRYEF
jgi:uncharacterized protein with NRDE domain